MLVLGQSSCCYGVRFDLFNLGLVELLNFALLVCSLRQLGRSLVTDPFRWLTLLRFRTKPGLQFMLWDNRSGCRQGCKGLSRSKGSSWRGKRRGRPEVKGIVVARAWRSKELGNWCWEDKGLT